MRVYIAVNYEEGKEIYFSSEKALVNFLDLQENQHYRGETIDPFKDDIFIPCKEETNSEDYLVEYNQFKSSLKSDYQHLAKSLFLASYSRFLSEEDLLKLIKKTNNNDSEKAYQTSSF